MGGRHQRLPSTASMSRSCPTHLGIRLAVIGLEPLDALFGVLRRQTALAYLTPVV
jgi:hypothetical protein